MKNLKEGEERMLPSFSGRTLGFHPGNAGSTPVGSTNIFKR